MPEADLFLIFVRRLDALGLPYMITGSVAAVFYGEPRVTHDVDLVLALRREDVEGFHRAFPLDDFYCPPVEILIDEVNRGQRGHFNLIHHATGFRADVYLAQRDPFHQWAMSERRPVEIEGFTVQLAPVEYVIVRKLEFFREGGSEKHLRDIRTMQSVSAELIRDEVLDAWVARLGLEEQRTKL